MQQPLRVHLQRQQRPLPSYQSFRGPVTEEDMLRWAFDLDGFIIVRGALDCGCQHGHTAANEERLLQQCTEHDELPPPVTETIKLLCGTQTEIHGGSSGEPVLAGTAANPMGLQREHDPVAFVTDRPPALLVPRDGAGDGGWETDTAPDELRRLEYDINSRPLDQTGQFVATVWGLRLVYCVCGSDSNILLVAPASHKSETPPPPMKVATAMGGTISVTLAPGDCVLAAATTLIGVAPHQGPSKLLQHVLVQQDIVGEPPRGIWRDSRTKHASSGGIVSACSPRPVAPKWHSELSEAQQALLTPMRNTVPSSAETRADAKHLAKLHKADELWFWDTFGFLVIKAVMDKRWLDAANASIDLCMAGPLYSDPAEQVDEQLASRHVVEYDKHVTESAECSPIIAPVDHVQEQRISQPWKQPGSLGAPFRAMIDCAELTSRLEWILGEGYYYTGSYAMVSPFGAAGQRIHSGPFYSHSQGYKIRRGNEPRQNGVNIGWALQDVVTARGDGGLILVPGSHKMRHPLPLPPTSSCELPQVKHIELKAGDVVIYLGGETAHGVRTWRNRQLHRRMFATKAFPNIMAKM